MKSADKVLNYLWFDLTEKLVLCGYYDKAFQTIARSKSTLSMTQINTNMHSSVAKDHLRF